MCMSASNVVLSRMQLTFHATRPAPHGASRLVQATSAWSAKTRRSPSRHYRDARVYGHTTTAMHDNEYAPPPYRSHYMQESPLSQAVLSTMQLTVHATSRTPHGASRLVQANVCLVGETRRAQSWHCRDARVYGHTTKAMHDNEYTPPPSTDLWLTSFSDKAAVAVGNT